MPEPGTTFGPAATPPCRAGSALLVALVGLALVLAAARPVLAASAGPQPSTTGVPALGAEPAEGLCISCHTSFPLNPDDAGTIVLEGVPARYEAGQVYKLTLRISHKDQAVLRWGFQMTAVVMKDGAGAGEFLASDAATTQVISAMSGTRSYIEHNYGGTAIGQTGGASWSFDWKAPAGGLGRIGFFAAANAANADGSNQGDRVYSHSPKPLAETDSNGG